MGKIKKIIENELVGGTQSTDVYPVTSVKAVYDENNERLDNILNRRGTVNISTNYNDDHTAEVLTLEQAIAKVPSSDRVLGFQGKFQTPEGWKSYIFTGDSVSNWSDISKWIELLSSADLAEELGDSTSKAISQMAVTTEIRTLAAITKPNDIWIRNSNIDILVSEKNTDEDGDYVNVTINNISPANILVLRNGRYNLSLIDNLVIRVPYEYGAIMLVSKGGEDLTKDNFVPVSFYGLDNAKSFYFSRFYTKYKDYNINAVLIIVEGKIAENNFLYKSRINDKLESANKQIHSNTAVIDFAKLVKKERFLENVTEKGVVNSTNKWFTNNTFNLTGKIIGIRTIDDCVVAIATITDKSNMSNSNIGEERFKLHGGLNILENPIQLKENQYLVFTKNVRLLHNGNADLYEITDNKINIGYSICISVVLSDSDITTEQLDSKIDANTNKIENITNEIENIRNSLFPKEYIGYDRLLDLRESINTSSVYYNDITNGTYIGVRIKAKAGTIDICKVTSNPIGSTTATYRVIKSFTIQSEDEGQLKDLLFDSPITLGENEYLGARGHIWYGLVKGYNMYKITRGSDVINVNYIIALNGIITSEVLPSLIDDVKENTKDISTLKNQVENIDTRNPLYIELQNDNLKSDNGNFTVHNWGYTNSGIKPSATGSTNYIMNNKVYHSDKRFMRVHVIMGTDTVLKIPVVWGGINAGEGASCFSIDFANKKLIIYAAGNGKDDQYSSTGYTNTELSTEVIPDEVIGNREYIIELHKDGTNHILKLLDTLTGESCKVSHNGWGAGRQNQYYAFYCESGTLPTLSNFQVFSLNRPDVVFVGDSITEGVMVTDRTKRYAEQFRTNNPDKKVVISARGGDAINGVLSKFATEYNIYKPKIMSVLIGANGGNTLENLTKLKTNCEAIGCTLILHRRTCQQSTDSHIKGNELIEQIGVNGARFDIATAKDNYPYVDGTHTSPRYNKSLYYDAGLHPNNEGDTKMYNRLLIDTPELFYN